ncbi:MAG: DUF6712 family protein [Alistipes sp.]
MIFNKNNQGAAELQRLVGIYFRSNDFSVIESEIKSAGGVVRRLIGPAVFDRAEKYYNSTDSGTQADGIDQQLQKAIQAPVAQLAMVRFYQQNTLSHEDGGRKVKINESSEKMPWQWQFDRDDDALLDKYYRALDDLYIFLEENTIDEWRNSPVREKLAACLIKDLDTFQSVFPLEDSHRMFYILVPFMLEVQERIIRPIIGDEQFEKMGTAPVPADLDEQLTAAKCCIPLYAIITAVKRMSIKVLPTMIVRRFSASFQGGRGGDMDDAATRSLLQSVEQEAIDAKTELQKAVTKRRQPMQEADLVPQNYREKKYFMT